MQTQHSKPSWLALLILATALSVPIQSVHAESTTPDSHENEEDHGEEEGHIALTPDQIRYAGIAIDRVGPSEIGETLPLYGQLVPNAEREHIVSARFPGVIREVAKKLGDSVEQGETLVIIESNESLKTYSVAATLTGVVTQRNANIGAHTGDGMLFVIGDYSTVWVDLSVFPSDLAKIHVGQKVKIMRSDGSGRSEGAIIAISPVGISANQTTTARVLLDNADRRWIPGLFVNAEVVLSQSLVPITIRDEAVQVVGDQSVVFVETDEGFEVRPVTLGRGDGEVSEVLAGLMAGEAYVTANSFVLKSELGKEDAEHGH
ncbi:MAG: efflux RND transporter periplasmic adaptor subunit [Halioglobus sp.]